eukprot:scaffold45010_cov59-Phaeocystis_antarctica.AAC.4
MATLGGYTYYSYTTMAIPPWLYLPRLHSPRQVLCVLSTTSCFAPRGVERLLDLARICLELDVPHFVNNAYGVQCTACMKAIAAASKHGRLDLFIQARTHPHPTPTLTMPFVPLRGLLNYLPRPFSSTLSTDKNFLVPVGGAVVATCSKEHGRPLLKKVSATYPKRAVSATYPGRASVSPILDLFCTLLHLGADGWAKLLADRQVTPALAPTLTLTLTVALA